MQCPYCQKQISFKEAKIRSTPENKYYFGVIVTILSDEIGYTKNEMHEILKEMFLREPKYIKTKEKVMEVWITKSTANLSISAFEHYLEQIRQWAISDMGILLPLPNEEG